jgi:hypothetical protein
VDHKERSEMSQTRASKSDDEVNTGKSTEQQNSEASLMDPSMSKTTTVSSPKDDAAMAPISTTSWFSIWPRSGVTTKATDVVPTSEAQPDDTSLGPPVAEIPVGTEPKRPSPGSTWAFWSRDSRTLVESAEAQESGELAVTGEATQDNPAPAHTAILTGNEGDRGKKSSKRGRQLPDDVQEPASKALQSDVSNKRL